MKKPFLFLSILFSLYCTQVLSQAATTISVSGTSSTSSITNNVATTVDAGLTITSDGTITGFTVMITGSYTSGDILAYTGTLPSGVSAGAFNTTSRSIQFTGTATAANWQTFLRTVTIRTTSATCYQEQRQVSFIAGYKFYNNLNGHFYELSASTSTWQSGLSNAATQSYFGRLGYMATITSQAENSFISKILAADSWIGATDDYTYINAATGTTTYASQAASEGKWYWACGPEKGTQMSTANQVNISTVYNSWNGGEPNNSGNENFCEIYVASGNWNDLNGTQGYKSIIEYGGMSTDDVSASVVFTRNLMISGAPSGTITGGNVSVCTGSNSTSLTISGLAGGGTVTKWQYSYDDFLTAGVDISNTTTTYTANNITQNTYYRAVVNASGCSALATSSTRINVNSAVAGNIVADNNTICNGASVNFTLNGYSGTITKWQVSTTSNFSSGVTDIGNTTAAMSYQLNTAGTYYFRAVVLSCSNTVYTNVYTVTVIAGTAPVGGSVNSSSFCAGSNSGTLTLSGYTGTVSKWQYSTDGGIVWTDVSNTTNTLSFSAITATRRYRAVLTNGSCGTALSAVGFVTVYSASVAGTASGAASVCAGTNSTNLSLSGNTGTIQWQSSANNSTFTDIAGATASSYTATNLSATTYYRAVVTNGVCTAANTSSVTVTVKATSTSTTNTSICPSALPYHWNSLTLNSAGSSTVHFTNSVGCDSAATLNLTVKSASSSLTDISVCASALPYSWNGLSFNVAGSQTAHLTNSQGCDSAATLNLSILSPSSSSTDISICATALPYSWNGLSFNVAGSQTAHLTNSVGCDSAATLNLSILSTSASTTDSSICPSALPFTWNGLTFNAAGAQTAHFTNAVGCDSAATINVTLLSTSTTDLSICPSALPYSWNGLTFNAAGAQTAYITTGTGCDSLATLNLSIFSTSSSSTDLSICPTALPYSWNGLTFNAAGSQTAHLTNSVGCDSAATLNLAVKSISTSTTNTSICPTALPYSWNGLTFNASGSQTAHLTNSVGCDSAATLNLTVLSTSTSTNTISVCPPQLPYSWNGLSFNAGGSLTAHLTNSVGCDSAATLTLIVLSATTSTTTITLPFGSSYTFNGTTYTTAGTYTAHLTNSVGCDSAATLVLTVNPKPSAGADHTIACGTGVAIDTLTGTLPTTGIWTSLAGNPASAVLSSTTNGVAVVTLPSAPYTGTIGFIYTTNGGADTMLIHIAGPIPPAIEEHTGTAAICRDGSVQLCPLTWGWSNYQWYKNGVAIAAPQGVSSCITLDSTGIGSYTLTATNGSGCWSNPSAATVVTYDTSCSISVTTGGGGGVESKTLGDVISKRLYGNAINSITEVSGYASAVKFVGSTTVVNGTQDLSLSNLVPATVVNTDNSYITTPSDLVTFTNAVEVLAVDYTKGTNTKAVIFGTKTLGDIYSHTKPICDRLKGAELLEVKTISINGYSLMAYKVRQRTGEIEYAANLSAGIATNRGTISLQSNWFTDSYQTDEKLYNFQLWAVSYDMVKSMAQSIIDKLQANGTINVVTATDLPKAYVSKGSRINTNLNLTIQNNTADTDGYFELKEKNNENSQVTTRKIPFTVNSNGISAIQLPVSDKYEANIYMYLNNKLVDLVYLSDGSWNLEYNKANTTISKFIIANEANPAVNNNEHRLFRNISLKATTKDYVTIYKTMTGGGLELNLSQYKGIKFTSSTTGTGKVKITIIKKGITKWDDQYSYTLNLDGDKEYGIGLSQFTSSKYKATINANDITAINFSYLNTNGGIMNVSVGLSAVRFIKEDIAYTNSLTSNALGIFPNPTTGEFNVGFMSQTEQALVLKIIDANTGKIVKTQFVHAKAGSNTTVVQLNTNVLENGLYLVSLEGDTVKYNTGKLFYNRK